MALINPPSFEKVAKRETTHEGELNSPRGKSIKIGGHIEYPYETAAVMNGHRGGDDISSAYNKQLGSRDFTPVETAKKGKLGDGNPGIE